MLSQVMCTLENRFCYIVHHSVRAQEILITHLTQNCVRSEEEEELPALPLIMIFNELESNYVITSSWEELLILSKDWRFWFEITTRFLDDHELKKASSPFFRVCRNREKSVRGCQAF